MVNLRKIGAIATGALFIGATLGAALAQTIPATFSKSMLADGGMAKAQLIVGGLTADAKAADTASATVIKDQVAKKLAVVGVGGKVKIDYGVYKWDDSDTDSNWFNGTGNAIEAGRLVTTNATVDGKILNVSKGTYGYLRIDANADGDFKDTEDYNIYSGAYVIDGTTGNIQFLYNFSTDTDTTYTFNRTGYATRDYAEGTTFKIKGKKYTITELTDDKTVKLAPNIRVSLEGVTTDMVANSVTVEGTRKLAWTTNGSDYASSGTLYLIDGAEVQQTKAFTGAGRFADADITATSFKGYKIWINNASFMKTVYVTVIDKNKEESISDTATDKFGYYKVYIDRDGTSPEFTAGGAGMYFVDAPLSLKLDGTVDVAGIEYDVKWETDKKMKLKRKKSTSVVSGTKLKSSYADYSPFLIGDITASVADGKVKVKYGTQKWDDSETIREWIVLGTGSPLYTATNLTTTGNRDGKILNVSKGTYGYLRIDANADGDFKDTEDYNIYSGAYVIDGTTGSIQFLYNFSTDTDTTYTLNRTGWATRDYAEGTTFKIKGKKYTITELTDDKTVKLAPNIRVSLEGVTTDMTTNAVTVEGTRKLAWKTNGSDYASSGTLYLIDGAEVQQTKAFTGAGRFADADITATSFKGYKIWINNASFMKTVYVTVIDKNKEESISDTKTDVFGYYKVYVDRDGTSPEFTAGGAGMYFVDAPLSLKLDGTIDVAGTEYYADWKTDKTMELQRTKYTSVASGTKLKSAYADYSPFLSADITATVTEAVTATPSLDIKNESTVDKTMNLVLLGGPVANKLTAELVTAKKSTIDWYTSAGDIEVVANAYTTGKSAIVVAGKNRDATKKAADALAAAL